MEIVTDAVNSSKFNNKGTNVQHFSGANNFLEPSGVRAHPKADGSYVGYMAMELSGRIGVQYNERLTQDERISD